MPHSSPPAPPIFCCARSGFEWADFDNDGDGLIDAIAFLHSGYAAEFGDVDAYGAAKEDRIWSHKWSLNDGSYITPWTNADGTLKVKDYHISPALWATSGSDIGRIGVIAHETGHFLGLPDLYDTSYEGSGIGSHCIMANSWGWSGTQYYPPAFSAWTKMQLGWSAVETITAGGDFSLTQSYSSNKLYKIVSPLSDTEYLLIENRQAAGYDVEYASYAAPGLAIWHIDDAKDEDYPIDSTGNSEGGYPGQSGWPANGKHYQVALVQADGNYDLEMGYSGDSGDLWSDSAAGLGPSDAAPSLAEGPFPNTDAYQVGSLGTTGLTINSISTSAEVMAFRLAIQVRPVALHFISAHGAHWTLDRMALFVRGRFRACASWHSAHRRHWARGGQRVLCAARLRRRYGLRYVCGLCQLKVAQRGSGRLSLPHVPFCVHSAPLCYQAPARSARQGLGWDPASLEAPRIVVRRGQRPTREALHIL